MTGQVRERVTREAKLDALQGQLSDAVAALVTGEDWKRALTFAAQFRALLLGRGRELVLQPAAAVDDAADAIGQHAQQAADAGQQEDRRHRQLNRVRDVDDRGVHGRIVPSATQPDHGVHADTEAAGPRLARDGGSRR